MGGLNPCRNKARIAADYQLRVDFILLHIDQEIIDLIDNSDELAAVQSTIDKANKSLAKIKAKTDGLGKASTGRPLSLVSLKSWSIGSKVRDCLLSSYLLQPMEPVTPHSLLSAVP